MKLPPLNPNLPTAQIQIPCDKCGHKTHVRIQVVAHKFELAVLSSQDQPKIIKNVPTFQPRQVV